MPASPIDTLDRIDRRITGFMHVWGHRMHAVTLGVAFVWLGGLKLAGQPTATTILAHTIYAGDPETMVRVLGAWELVIGVSLIVPPLRRFALLLLAIRLPGTLLALFLKPDVCFVTPPLVPTVEGQYIIKDFLLFAAAMVIGGTIREHKEGHAT